MPDFVVSGTEAVESIPTSNANELSGVREESDDSAIHSGDDVDELEKYAESLATERPSKDSKDVPEPANENTELLYLPDSLLSLTVSPPNSKSFQVQVSPQEIVQELHHLLMDHETTCHRTCFSLRLNELKMDNFTELKNIPDLKNGSEIRVVEEPYSLRESKFHLRHVRELLNSLDFEEAHLGTEGRSLSYLNLITHTDVSDEALSKSDFTTNSSGPNLPSSGGLASSSRSNSPPNRSHSRADSDDETKLTNNNKLYRYKSLLSQLPKFVDPASCKPPDHALPGIREPSLVHMHPEIPTKVKPCLKVMTMSIWNPPPQNRKLHGDLLYLYIVTLEDKHLHITSSSKGFYVNKSDHLNFDPKPDTFSPPSHSLIDLLSEVSSGFRTNFPALNKIRCARHIFERIGTPFQLHSWSAPARNHQVNHVHAEDFMTTRTSIEDNIPGQASRDWNEELAATREMPKATLPERLIRERAMFKAHCDFVAAATRGAVMVVDGNIMPINPGEDKKMQMFIWNNIFFSLGFDVKDHYKDLGGNNAAFYAPLADLNGLRAYQAVDVDGLHLLGTVVVDYRGFRVTAQSIIPGILEREQEQSIVHGSIDFGKNVLTNIVFTDLIEKVSKPLRQLKHSVHSGEGNNENIVEIFTSVECKGITGNDGRHYVLDLLRTFPPDVNFLEHDDELFPHCKSLGFPKKHRHGLATLRPELVESFSEHKYIEFMQSCAKQIFALRKLDCSCADQGELKIETQSLTEGMSQSAIEAHSVSKEGDASSHGSLQRAVVKEAAQKAGSCTDSEFDLRFNPDLYTRTVRVADPQQEVERQKNLLKEAAEYLVAVQIPNFIRECALQTILPVDGFSLVDVLHERGISVRYLGKILQMLPDNNQLTYLKRICTMELYSRCARHAFRCYIQCVSQACICAAVVHFLNCLLSSSKVSMSVQEHDTSKKRKKKGRQNNSTNDWSKLTSHTLWVQISDEARDYFDHLSSCNTIDDLVEREKIQKISFLRCFCMKNGIQVLSRDYDFDSKHKPTFFEDDILDVYPIVKHSPPRASDAYHFFATGQVKIQQGAVKQAVEYINESLSLFNNVYGAMHLEIATCYRSIARLQYIAGEYADAVCNQQKALIMFERVLGIDHASTMFAFVNLSVYCFANGQVQSSLKLLYRAKYLMGVAFGDDHPDMAQINSTIGLVLHGLQDYDLSLTYLLEALKISVLVGKRNLKLAMSYHLVARAYSCKGNFRQALNNEKQTFRIYQTVLGDDHEKTKESAEFLRHLTQQAVSLQRTMNEIFKKGSKAAIPPLQIMPPNLSSVVELINAISGIVRVTIEPPSKIANPVDQTKSEADYEPES